MTILPLNHGVEILDFSEPQAILIIGILTLLLWGAINYRNPMAAVSWAGNVLIFIMVGILRVGIELFWLSVVGTIVILIAGLVVRWAG